MKPTYFLFPLRTLFSPHSFLYTETCFIWFLRTANGSCCLLGFGVHFLLLKNPNGNTNLSRDAPFTGEKAEELGGEQIGLWSCGCWSKAS